MTTDSISSISLEPVTTAVEHLRFVVITAAGLVDHAGANADSVGVTLRGSPANETLAIPVGVADGARHQVEASAAIVAGANIAVAASGKAVTAASGGVVQGVALTSADVDGEVIDFIFTKAGTALA